MLSLVWGLSILLIFPKNHGHFFSCFFVSCVHSFSSFFIISLFSTKINFFFLVTLILLCCSFSNPLCYKFKLLNLDIYSSQIYALNGLPCPTNTPLGLSHIDGPLYFHFNSIWNIIWNLPWLLLWPMDYLKVCHLIYNFLYLLISQLHFSERTYCVTYLWNLLLHTILVKILCVFEKNLYSAVVGYSVL